MALRVAWEYDSGYEADYEVKARQPQIYRATPNPPVRGGLHILSCLVYTPNRREAKETDSGSRLRTAVVSSFWSVLSEGGRQTWASKII